MRISKRQDKDQFAYILASFQHVVSHPPRDGDKRNSLGVIANLLDIAGNFLDNLVEARLNLKCAQIQRGSLRLID